MKIYLEIIRIEFCVEYLLKKTFFTDSMVIKCAVWLGTLCILSKH